MKSIIYIGMDAHKNTYSLCGSYSSIGEIAVQTKCDADVKNILKFIESAKERVGEDNEIEVIAGYEAGCLGFSLYHELAYHDVQCVILAPSTMHGSYKAVHVPTEHDNEIKEYIGLREDIIISRKRIKQQRSALAYAMDSDMKVKATGQLHTSNGWKQSIFL